MKPVFVRYSGYEGGEEASLGAAWSGGLWGITNTSLMPFFPIAAKHT